MTLREHIAAQVGRLLTRLTDATRRAGDEPTEATVHAMRVSIRRFTGTMRAYAALFPAREAKRTRRKLRPLMQAAAAVRNRDIALKLLEESGQRLDGPLAARLRQDRDAAQAELVALVHAWQERDHAARWRAQLGLPAA